MSDQHIFFLLKDPVWDKLKPEKIHLFTKDYLSDGSDKLINDVADYAKELLSKKMFYEDSFAFSYWTFDAKAYFIDLFVTADLLNDARAWIDFKAWLSTAISLWANTNKLPFKVELDKANEFYLKFIITVGTAAT